VIGWDAARSIVGALPPLPHELIALTAGIGRRMVHDLATDIDIPHFASAAMDGWLTRGNGPWHLSADPLEPGQARPVVTGALVPEGSTAVLRGESGQVVGELLESINPREPQIDHHIRPRGAEASQGEVLIRGGTVLNPAHLALAASAGVDTLDVHARPRVSLIYSGDEIVTSGRPAPGRVRDSFGVQLPQLFAMMGAEVESAHRTPDDLTATVASLAAAAGPVIVTTGGTGHSSADHLRAALEILGARMLIDGIAMRPGSPTVLAQLPDGRIVVGLPGNPLAAMVVAITIVEPMLAALSGSGPRPTRELTSASIAGRAGSTRVTPFVLIDGRATISPWHGAGMMRGLASADGLLVIPEAGLHDGDRAMWIELPWRPCSDFQPA
jgi:molybdopterin molybdotransferase